MDVNKKTSRSSRSADTGAVSSMNSFSRCQRTQSPTMVLIFVHLLCFHFGAAAAAECAPPGDSTGVLFFDSFQKAPVEPWTWIRENPRAHRSTEGGLEIRLEPGGLMGGGRDAKNILVRPLPIESKFVSVYVKADHKSQYEQAGLILYGDDDNYVKLVLEMVDGRLWIVFIAEIEAAPKLLGRSPAPGGGLWVGLAFEGGKVTGHAWNGRGKHNVVGTGRFPVKPGLRVGVFTQSGQAGADRWATFRDFRIYRSEPPVPNVPEAPE